MQNHDKSIDKKIAAFIVVSASLSIPAVMETDTAAVFSDTVMFDKPFDVIAPNVMRYAGPAIPGDVIAPNVMRYAGPAIPGDVIAPNVMRYAGPVIPEVAPISIKPVVNDIVPVTNSELPTLNYDNQKIPAVDANVQVNNTGETVIQMNYYGAQQLGPGHFLFK